MADSKRTTERALYLFGRRIRETKHSSDARWNKFLEASEKSDFWKTKHDVAVFIDFRVSPSHVRNLVAARKLRRILVQVEPRTVNPVQYSKILRFFFHHHITQPNHSYYSLARHFWTPGYDFTDKVSQAQTERKALGTLASHKHSFVQGSQYHLRLQILQAARDGGIPAHLAGRGWNENSVIARLKFFLEFCRAALAGAPLRPGSLGALFHPCCEMGGAVPSFEHAAEFWSSVDCALVVENEQGLISEKLFDAVSQGCAVVYVGRKIPSCESILSFEGESTISMESIIQFASSRSHEARNQKPSTIRVVRSLAPTVKEGFEDLLQKISEVSAK